jgi:hypothetical protein
MKSRLILFATWLNSDPRRARLLTFATATALAFILSAPHGLAFSPEATSGS